METTHIGSTLRGQRKRLGMTQAQLAELAGISTVTISQLEAGKGDVRLGTLTRLCDAVGLELVVRIRGTGGDA
jgi:HTH-type transcriptional regulator / antitoxin HipB